MHFVGLHYMVEYELGLHVTGKKMLVKICKLALIMQNHITKNCMI